MRINGKEISTNKKQDIIKKIEDLKLAGKRIPQLVVIVVGSDPASLTYVASKEKTAKELGILEKTFYLDEKTSQSDLLGLIEDLNNDDLVDGILVQLPLPKHIDSDLVIDTINPKKDVDGFTRVNIASLVLGRPEIVSCTPKGIMSIIESVNYDLSGKHAVVVGRSNIVGKPMSNLLLNAHATVTICHSKTKDLHKITSLADVLIVAVGIPNFIKEGHVKEGAFVIDVGINRVDSKLVGDCEYDKIYEKTLHITPVPGGVGPMTIVSLFENTLELYLKNEKK